MGASLFSQPVALKLFSPETHQNAGDYRHEVARIAEIAVEVARIQHNNVVAVQDFIEISGIMVMEMEWIDGYDLRRLLTPDTLEQVHDRATQGHWQKLNREIVTSGASQSRVKPPMAIAITRECLRGLSAMHQAEIVHNDIKPSNIMLKRSGNVKLIDIGSAFSLSNIPAKIACTPGYAAPEVLGGQNATIQSDLASLGYVLIEMLSGTRPFHDMSLKDMIAAKQEIFQLLPRILPAEEFAYFDLLLPLLRKLVAPDPDERFQSADEADQAGDGAGSFEGELVKGDLWHWYESEIREWMREIDSVSHPDEDLPVTKTLWPHNDL